MPDHLRIGLLGASGIAPNAVIAPARELERVEVVGVAARDPQRAEAYARTHGLGRTWASYDELIASDDVDAVYVGLPPSTHFEWTVRALEAGKHVLCEKPFALSVAQAEAMVTAAERTGLVLGEAFHWRYHPLALRMRELLEAGAAGEVHRITTEFSAGISDRNDIRWQLGLGGGALMDLGCYAVQWHRFAAGAEPTVLAARALTEEEFPGIDVALEVEVTYDNGVTGSIRTSMRPEAFAAYVDVEGSAGRLHVHNPVLPHYGHELRLTQADQTTSETFAEAKPTYFYQLKAYVEAVLDGAEFPTSGADSIATMKVIEEAYAAAGLPPRG